MSHEETAAIDELRKTIRWLVGGVLGLLGAAAAVGGWVATQEARLRNLEEFDRISLSDRIDLRAELKSQSSMITAVRQDSALQNRDLQYIREAVTEIKQVLKR